MIEIDWHTEKRKISALKEWKDNPRTISDKAYERLKGSITKRGFHDVLKIDENNVVLSGNQRLRALRELGVEEVECKVANRKLTQDEKDAVALESNTQDGEWDMDKLAEGYGDVMEEIGFGDLMPETFGDKNEEIDINDFEDVGVIKFRFPEEDYMRVLGLIANAVEKTQSNTNEECLLKLLQEYE